MATTTRHDTLYFDEPETLIFEVGGTLFRPHTFLLRRYSEFFRDILSLGFEKQLEGYSDSLPIVLADVHLADGDYPEIGAEEFELALSVMCPEVLIKSSPKSSAQWCKVLDVAERWQSTLLRDTAIAHLAKSDLHVSMRLMISTKYNVPEWLPDILPELCLQRSFPSDDIALLSPSLIVPFFSAREEFRNQLVFRVSVLERCYKKTCAGSDTERGNLCDRLRDSLSYTPDLGRPDHSSLTKVFQTLLSSPTSCRDCVPRCNEMISTCEDYGRSLVRKRCFPKKKKKFSRLGCRVNYGVLLLNSYGLVVHVFSILRVSGNIPIMINQFVLHGL